MSLCNVDKEKYFIYFLGSLICEPMCLMFPSDDQLIFAPYNYTDLCLFIESKFIFSLLLNDSPCES